MPKVHILDTPEEINARPEPSSSLAEIGAPGSDENSPNTAAERAAPPLSPSGRRDTHGVGWAGRSDRVIVVPKKLTTKRWALGSDEREEWSEELWTTFKLTPIFNISAVASIVLLLVLLVHSDTVDQRWFWLPAFLGVWFWLVSLI